MARRKIREYDAKTMIVKALAQDGISLQWKGILVTPEIDLNPLPQRYPWLLTTPLAAKPDQLFGKRGKLGLIIVNSTFNQVQEFLQNHRNKETTIGKATDKLTHFLIEPYIPHEKEYYLSLTSEREGIAIYFSTEGGI